LKHHLIYILLFTFGLSSHAQTMQLKLIGNSVSETKTIDSLGYLSDHKNAKSIADELELIVEKLSKIGFITNKILPQNKVSDSSYTVKLNLGTRIKWLNIYRYKFYPKRIVVSKRE